MQKLNNIFDTLSEFLAKRKGLLPILGLILILVNAVLSFFPGVGWLINTNILLHMGVIIAIIGFMVAWAL
jgi:hypothetical protein